MTGFGPLAATDAQPAAVASDLTAGLLARFEDGLWPIGPRPLGAHPALAGHPGLAAALDRDRDAVRAAMAEGPFVLVHSDLHEENILSDGGRLAFIDFGETFVGTAAWEVATFAYFTVVGRWPTHWTRTLAGEWRRRRPASAVSASLLALSWGLIRWEQDRRRDGPRHGRPTTRASCGRPSPRIQTATIGPMEIMGVQIRTIVKDNVASRCDGCLEVIDGHALAGQPPRHRRAPRRRSPGPTRPTINPGPFQFHRDPACVRRWMAGRATCSAAAARSARSCGPIAIPTESARAGACATASIATTTSSSRPDRAIRRARSDDPRRRFDRRSAGAPILRPPGRIGDTQIYPDSAATILSTGRSSVSPHARRPVGTPSPRPACPTPPLPDPAGCRSDRPAGCSASTPTRSGAGPTRAGSRRT